MGTMTINDLPKTEELDSKAMAAVHGGAGPVDGITAGPVDGITAGPVDGFTLGHVATILPIPVTSGVGGKGL